LPLPPEKQKFKVRSDLEITEQVHRGEKYYVIKDPLALRYFRMSSLEFEVFSLLDGNHTAEDIKKIINERYPDIELDIPVILHFIYNLKGINFLERMFVREDKILYERAQLRKKMFTLRYQLRNILFLKFPLVDPDRFFDKTEPYVRFIFTRGFLVFFFGVIFLAIWQLIHHFGERVPFEALFALTPTNIGFFWIAFVFTKIIHELGHGYTCKHYGGEVHEMGFLLLVFTPCLYCDVSDAWIFKNKRHKLLVSSAGIIAELLIAAIACIIWSISPMGVIKGLAYRVMFLCSVSSILFNANPLMKFDGYYMLSDYLEIPNLRKRSLSYISTFLKERILGMTVTDQPEVDEEDAQLLVTYGIATTAWLFLLMLGICTFLLKKVYVLGLWVTFSSVIGMVVIPTKRFISFVVKNKKDINVKKSVIFGLIVVVAAGVYLVFFLPLDYWIKSACVVEPSNKKIVRVVTPGLLESFAVKPGDMVKKGQVVAVLKDEERAARFRELQKNIEAYDLKIRQLIGIDKKAEANVVIKQRDGLKQNLAVLQEEIDGLTLRAPSDGIVLSLEYERQLNPSLLLGRAYRKGDGLCAIGRIDDVIVRILVHEENIGEVKEGQPVVLKFQPFPGEVFHGTVSNIDKASEEVIRTLPLSIRSGGPIVTITTREGQKPVIPYYEVTVLIENKDLRLKPGFTGEAKIYCGKKTLGERMARFLWKRIRQMFGV